MNALLDKIVTLTEGFLTWRARRKWKRKQKQKQKNMILDWVEAFVWSAFVVLLVNQYFFQAYAIPSSSMENTLLVQDRIFVNKFVYGPELLPGIGKLTGLKTPQRGDIIIFESPDYNSNGPAFDIAQRLIYMMTLSLVDIDRKPDGSEKVHFLIKRGVGYSGDTVRFREGNPEFLPAGESDWISEEELKKSCGLTYTSKRENPDVKKQYYDLVPLAANGIAREKLGLKPTPEQVDAKEKIDGLLTTYNSDMKHPAFHPDDVEYERQMSSYILQIAPHSADALSFYMRLENGHYVPENAVLPLGDNRDNSHDGRYFGPIAQEKILGQAAFRYWPLGERFGEIR